MMFTGNYNTLDTPPAYRQSLGSRRKNSTCTQWTGVVRNVNMGFGFQIIPMIVLTVNWLSEIDKKERYHLCISVNSLLLNSSLLFCQHIFIFIHHKGSTQSIIYYLRCSNCLSPRLQRSGKHSLHIVIDWLIETVYSTVITVVIVVFGVLLYNKTRYLYELCLLVVGSPCSSAFLSRVSLKYLFYRVLGYFETSIVFSVSFSFFSTRFAVFFVLPFNGEWKLFIRCGTAVSAVTTPSVVSCSLVLLVLHDFTAKTIRILKWNWNKTVADSNGGGRWGRPPPIDSELCSKSRFLTYNRRIVRCVQYLQ